MYIVFWAFSLSLLNRNFSDNLVSVIINLFFLVIFASNNQRINGVFDILVSLRYLYKYMYKFMQREKFQKSMKIGINKFLVYY